MSVFSFIADEIEEQFNQYKRQAEQTERVVNPIQGGAWIGQGARAFIQEVMTRVIPQIMELIAAIAGFGGNIGKALNIMNQADKMVGGIARQLGDVFDSIF